MCYGGVFQAMSPAHSVHSLSPTQPLGEGHYPGPGGEAHQPTNSFPTPPTSQPPHTAHSGHSAHTAHSASTSEPNMLRAALTHREQQQQQQQTHRGSPGRSDTAGGPGSGGGSSGPGHMPDFVDFDTPIQGGLDCNVEEVGLAWWWPVPGGGRAGRKTRAPPQELALPNTVVTTRIS